MLSDRYIGDRFLPDKAIDLIDESASRLRIEIDSLPQEIDEVERKIVQLEIEKQALQKESDPASRERLDRVEAEIADLRERSSGMKAQWQAEKQAISGLREMKERLDALKVEVERATRIGDLARAAEIQYGEMPALQRKSAPTTSPRSWPAGPGSRYRGCCSPSGAGWRTWTSTSTSA
jgi:ATP-dependent Clp protease ATP-binding subunit ClpB